LVTLARLLLWQRDREGNEMRITAGCLIFLAILPWACGPAPDDGDRDPVCIDDGHTDGPPCLEKVETDEEFKRIAKESGPDYRRVWATKFMLPARDGSDLLPLTLQNANRYNLHLCYLCCAFPDRFGPCNCEDLPESCPSDGGITPGDYLELIMKRDTRSYFAGVIQRVEDPGKGLLYGFNVWTDLVDPAEQLELKEVRTLYHAIHQVFAPETLVYLPTDMPAIEKARSWIDPDFPVHLGFDEVNTEVYTQGTCYGRVRRYTVQELDEAIARGELSWQDIVVVDRVPFDIEAVVAGVVTGGRQWELSHVNVRMARRGTPNLYVRDALEAFSGHDGALVRLEATRGVSNDRYTVEAATLQEAEAWWADHRPDIGDAPAIQRDFRLLETPDQMDTDDDPVPLISFYGGKVANLARLFVFLPEPYTVPAFGIPFAWFEDFMEDNTIVDQRLDPPEEVSLREYVERLVADERFATDTAYRRALLWDLRTRMEHSGRVDPELTGALAERIGEVFGSTGVKVRFRSSSNVEDALEFSGAGLYSSTSVCAMDSLDGDRTGPSWCDSSQDEERGIERGLKRVWASLYNTRAWEERDWYQVPQEQASMAVLVSLAFSDEQANGVAFTGNPMSTTDDRYLINAQLGDEPVVGNDPRIVPERDLLRMDDTGRLERIYRSRSSALTEPGSYVLDDEQLKELGELLFVIDRDYPQDTGDYNREQVLLDLEFKVDPEGSLRIKQIRPFLDKCRKVVCNQPPDDICKDDQTKIHYSSFGSCDPGSGECRYDSSEQQCDNGCADGSCL
jgi:hypothetical protein